MRGLCIMMKIATAETNHDYRNNDKHKHRQ